ncbi:hypothetical protein [Erysipelothrix anatis]|uniref:hypothetical protein n=1 Tax=Erysipelothrix anatis TaxID=2683713 RepID=UPI0014099B13|nr:hypothetical protein [Erysipelothrix anatis]
MKKIIKKALNKLNEMKFKLTSSALGVAVAGKFTTLSVSASVIEAELTPYKNKAVSEAQGFVNVVGLIMLIVAGVLLLIGKRDEAKITAIGTVVGYIVVHGVVALWGIVTGA